MPPSKPPPHHHPFPPAHLAFSLSFQLSSLPLADPNFFSARGGSLIKRSRCPEGIEKARSLSFKHLFITLPRSNSAKIFSPFVFVRYISYPVQLHFFHRVILHRVQHPSTTSSSSIVLLKNGLFFFLFFNPLFLSKGINPTISRAI